MKKLLLFSLILSLFAPQVSLAGSITDSTRGRIVLQVEQHGEAWYVHPKTGLRSYMPDGPSAYELMRSSGLGITNLNLEGIPVINDVHEIQKAASVCSTNSLANSVKGEILLQVEEHGEAWYVFPENCQRIYMADGDAAYEIMRFLGLGITDNDLRSIRQDFGNSFAPSVKEVHIRGAADAKVKIVEYCDLQGPFCKKVQSTLNSLLLDYVGQIQIEFRHFPLSFHEYAQKAAEAAECAADQGVFWEYHDLVYGEQDMLNNNGVAQLKFWASELGLDTAMFDSCLDTGAKTDVVLEDIEQGNLDGVTGTPHFSINGNVLMGAQPYSAFAEMIEAKLVEPVIEPTEHSFGSADAPVTIIEYADFECPFCQQVNATLDQLLNDYSGKVRHVYKHFPLSFHPHAQKAAEASECAADQGEFWLYHATIYDQQSLLSGGVDQLKAWASDIGLDRQAFDTCLDSGEKANKVVSDYEEGVDAGISGTPGFLINGELVHGALPYDVFAELIESKLNQ